MMLYRVLKLVRFTVKKEVGKVVKTMGDPGEELTSFEKFRARAPGVQKGPKKGPKIFKILNFENVETFRNFLVPP